MSRNGNGTYNLPAGNPVVTGTTISSTWANNTLADIQNALTGSIAADGQTPITGGLKGTNGTVTFAGVGQTRIPAGTTAQRASSPTDGMIRYNTDLQQYEGYKNGAWSIFGNGAGGTLFSDTVTATQGQTVITMPTGYVLGGDNLSVYVNGSRQIYNVNYTETTTTSFTFTTGLNAGDLVNYTIGASTSLSVNASSVLYNEGSTGAVDTNVELKLQEIVSVKDFGAVGDGITDDTDAIQNALNVASNKTILFPAGTYKITYLLSVDTLVNCSLIGEGNASIVGDFDYTMIQFVSTTNFSIRNIKFDNQYINATLTGSGATVVWTETASIDCNIDNVTIDGCTFTNPDCQGQAIFFAFRTVQNPATYRIGVMRNLTVSNNNFVDIGGIGMTLMNRQTSTDRYTCVSGIKIQNNFANGLGVVASATYGMFVSLDGFGQDFIVSNNSIYGHKGSAIECVGWCNGLIDGNSVGTGKSATTYRAFSLDGDGVFSGPSTGTTAARVSGVQVTNNNCITDQTIYDYVIGADNCSLTNNIHRTLGAPYYGAMYVYNSTYINFNNCQFFSNNYAAIKIGDGTSTTTNVVLENCVFDNSSSAASTALIYFDGTNTKKNIASGVIKQAATGVDWIQANSASDNSISNQYYALSGQYTPTVTAISNITSTTAYLCQWFRVGNMVTVSGRFDVLAVGAGNSQISISLPAVVASNFTAPEQLAGTAASYEGNPNEAGGFVANPTTDVALLKWRSSILIDHAMSFSFTYIIQ
jgi:hypothetical protein